MNGVWAIFISIFLAELGDKTQIAAVLFATDQERSPYTVFIAASLALIASTALAVLLGSFLSKYLVDFPLKLIAGIGFIAIGCWTVYDHFKHTT